MRLEGLDGPWRARPTSVLRAAHVIARVMRRGPVDRAGDDWTVDTLA